MAKQTSGKRILVCSFIALTAGLFGAYVGGQLSLAAHTQKCDVGTEQELSIARLVKPLCQMKETPGALWQGSTTGLWTGTILGAFIGGLATRKTTDKAGRERGGTGKRF